MFSKVKEKIQALEAKLERLELESRALEEKRIALLGNVTEPLIKFFPLSSRVDAAFWKQLEDRKLNEYRLSSAPVPITSAYYSFNNDDAGQSWLEVRADLMEEEDGCGNGSNEFPATGGILINVNTMEEFKSLDKAELARAQVREFIQALESGEFFQNCAKHLTRFLLISFADLKRHSFVYWFAFPALANVQVKGHSVLLESALPGWFEQQTRALPAFFFLNEEGTALPLEQWTKLPTCSTPVTLGFADASPNSSAPGWFLRNLIQACVHPRGLNLAGQRIRVICLREPVLAVRRKAKTSTVWEFTLPAAQLDEQASVIGWEPNAQGQMKPRSVDLSPLFDSSKVSEAAVNLNLKLMKWRAFPELNERKLQELKVLILGCGTLGCAVIRGLMGWGVKHLTLVDSGKVSMSNPVRQSLYVSEDVGKGKADTARNRVLEIHPAMQVDVWPGGIPMPGHSSPSEDVDKLAELVQAHDVICLLTDTRESRWLPTLLSAHFGKLCLNAALDFDSFLVMRHGRGINSKDDNALGCYFCSDVMAPRNSTRNRTLDQQCTVTRPGLAPIAGALLVEMLIALMHHPLGAQAPPPQHSSTSSKLGVGTVPHVIRGHLGSFAQEQSVAQSFPQCTACSQLVCEEYAARGADFVQRVLSDPDHLDTITGLDKLKLAFDAGADDGLWEEEEE